MHFRMQLYAIRRMLFVDYAICALGGSGDEAINESHKCLHLTPVDGSSVIFFSSEP